MYGRLVVNYRPEKTDAYRTRLTVVGDRVNHPGDYGTPTVELTTVKLLFNSIVSTLNAKFITMDRNDFYLNTLMARSKYMRLKLSNLPETVLQHYNLAEKATMDVYVHVEIKRGMYGLLQAGLIAQQLLYKQLNKKDYSPK